MTKKRKQPVKTTTRDRAKRANPATPRQSKIGNFESKLDELCSDDERLDALLSLEKSSRGVDQKQLVFAGLSDVSAQTFCSMNAVLSARESERMYFEAYLMDRLYYANELRALERWPRSSVELLQAGQSITFEQVEAVEKSHLSNEYRAGKSGSTIKR